MCEGSRFYFWLLGLPAIINTDVYILVPSRVIAFFNYVHSFPSNNNNYSLSDATLYDKNTCFSPNDKLIDSNNNNWTHVFENAKDSVVKVVTVSNPYGNPEISTGFIYDRYKGEYTRDLAWQVERIVDAG